MSLRHITISLCLILIGIAPLAAISQGSLLFLTFEPGGRANGMGRAYSAVADDAYAMWWNPGATAFNRKGQIAANHIPWLQGSGLNDMFYEYLGWNQYFEGIGNINAHIVLLDAGTQDQTDSSGLDLGRFHSFDIAGAVGYADEVIPGKLGVGANFKLIYSYLAPATGLTDTEGKAFSFGFDLGAKYLDLADVKGLDAALVIQNIGPNVTFVDQEQADPSPMTVRLGTAYTVFESPINSLILSAEASKMLANEDALFERFVTGWDPIDETIFGLGAEYNYLELISLRGGYFADTAGEITGPSFGLGIEYKFDNRYKLNADFSMVPAGELTDFNKVFSLGFEF
ncbi:MAG: PorV/PorQ family protein [Candidatus Cloacimonetes bacterium]|nr:PorV/PorQ family protein [Candidatus Cloacimonadota bacterium]HOA28527.1 PorV/PorQ family protein [Candidatus Cloacimonadota bacterium]HOH59451.1 PorV/PorQ family protein [Candidatus Cloacimonadota bacterium]HPI25113.1 PorV/PorQ family protein [Candidatus Cloacimonadota bacterium]